MIANSILVDKLTAHCKTARPNQTNLAACCKELLQNFKFDCVFIAQSNAPEETPVSLAYEGKEEVMDTCLYRLGIEERVALSKLPLKNFLDMTGKPVFNKSGSLRIQKPNSGIFMVHYKAKEHYLLLGCAHQDSRPYDQDLLNNLSIIWKAWQEVLAQAVQQVLRSGKGVPPPAPPVPLVEPPVKAPSLQPAPPLTAPLVSAPATTVKAEEKGGDHKRPVILVDEVTRLFNKDYFEECLAIEVERAKRYSRNVSLLFISVTPLDPSTAKISENLVATQVAEILFKSLRRVDIICRLEKEKYGIILPDTDNNTYGIIAKRVFKFFKQVMGEAPPVFLNISASTYPKHAGNHLLLFENTEKLLAQAKEVGPNKAVLPE